jgi:uncharacterized protein with NAD-binding domain and iron-sulfur cluster
VAGLTAAYELTKAGRCAGESVVVYQVGWRLGGKCASARDAKGRIVEHGLHIWFGYYENAFRLLREICEEAGALSGTREAVGARLPSVIAPQAFTPIGRGPKQPPLPLEWPRNPGEPGLGRAPSLIDGLAGVVRLLHSVHAALENRDGGLTLSNARIAPPAGPPATPLEPVSIRAALARGIAWVSGMSIDHTPGPEFESASRYFNLLADEAQRHAGTEDDRFLGELYDLVGALVAGVLGDVVLRGWGLGELDRYDFRQWLVLRGADAASAYESPLVRALYDTMFQYPQGDASAPSYGAGTAAQVVLRLLGTYSGHAVWKPQGSLGETLIAPLYKVLRARGVRFEFFHKLERIELTPDETSVKALHFLRQAEVTDGDYDPLVLDTAGKPVWPSTPKWGRIRGGEALRKPDVDLESRWCEENVGRVRLDQGGHFSDAVLAIPLGAFKRFPRARGPCDELIRASPRFRALAENVALVPSLSVQVWSSRTLAELGWPWGSPALVSGPQPLQIWADMTQIIDREDWVADRPRSLHYFCNVLDSGQYWIKAEAVSKISKLAVDWFNNSALQFWPKAAVPDSSGKFDWNVLFNGSAPADEARIEAQVVTANVDPSACCASSAAGMTQWRLRAGDSGFTHLVLAGAWTDTGLNTECIEAAVMSGMQASRALCGLPSVVFGEDFLDAGQGSLAWRLATGIASLVFR